MRIRFVCLLFLVTFVGLYGLERSLAVSENRQYKAMVSENSQCSPSLIKEDNYPEKKPKIFKHKLRKSHEKSHNGKPQNLEIQKNTSAGLKIMLIVIQGKK